MQCEHFGVCGSCGLFNDSYEKQLTQKHNRIKALLKRFDAPLPVLFDSPQSHYRARAEFRIWHTGDRCSYAMGNITKNGTICIEECPKVIKPIANRMWDLLDSINSHKKLSHKLFGIEFLATTTNECLVTMLYHKKLDEEWSDIAKTLEIKHDISIIGRSRKQKLSLSKEFVAEVESLLDDWDDAHAVASSTSRIALGPAVAEMQKIRRKAADLEAPKCAEPAKEALLQYMDSVIAGYLAFMSDEPDSTIAEHFEKAQTEMSVFLLEFVKLKFGDDEQPE